MEKGKIILVHLIQSMQEVKYKMGHYYIFFRVNVSVDASLLVFCIEEFFSSTDLFLFEGGL